jgi:hypothetical protein
MSYDLRAQLIGDGGQGSGNHQLDEDGVDDSFYDGDGMFDGYQGLNEEERDALAAPGLGSEGIYASNAGGDTFIDEQELETIVRKRYVHCSFRCRD